jgi:protein-S-isoprenylcysteine O-methyltransferase Ste14
MSVCRIRLILWLFLAGISIAGGIAIDLILQTQPFPLLVRFLGLTGLVLAHFPLKRTGKLLKLMGESKEWGCTSRLVTIDVYQCVRHPHHLAVGIFMTSLGLLIGHLWSFLIITIIQWSWVLGFLFLVEEPELVKKFGAEYQAYHQQVPMLFPKLLCILQVLTKPMGWVQNQPPENSI